MGGAGSELLKMKRSEFEWIHWLTQRIPKRLQGRPGIGDDAAVLPDGGSESLLFTTDTLVEGVDFRLRDARPELVGRKALAVNLSDIAAMGGRPLAFVMALGIPRNFNNAWVEKFYQGAIRMAKEYKTLWVGGDLSRSRQFFVTIALLGCAKRREIIFRRGAKPGDWIGVTGSLGGSILGKHFRFHPKIREGCFLASRFHPTAMMDSSDGLLQDLGHILKASGVGADIDLDKIPVSAAARQLAKKDPQRALKHALTDGEDFELLFTMPPGKAKRCKKVWQRSFSGSKLTWIGRIRTRKGASIAYFNRSRSVSAPAFKRYGFSHF